VCGWRDGYPPAALPARLSDEPRGRSRLPLDDLEWEFTSAVDDTRAAEGIAALKTEDGPELQVHGSGNLIQTLLRHNLVDQYRLWVFPLVIGSGRRLFSEGTVPSGLKLVDRQVSTTGVMIGTYEPAGEIVTGSFALD